LLRPCTRAYSHQANERPRCRRRAASLTSFHSLRVGNAGGRLVCGLPWLVLIDYLPPPLARPLARNLNPFIWPPAETPVIKFLIGEVALQPGWAFRGRVANIAGSDFEPQYVSAPFINQHIYDGMSLFFSGNNHRSNGLWYYDISDTV
jgi:hypothetical protein